LQDHPIARLDHVARNLSMDRIHIVHQSRRRDDAGNKNKGRNRQQRQVITPLPGGRPRRHVGTGAFRPIQEFGYRSNKSIPSMVFSMVF
jgi:hypothetical protein